MHISLTLKRAKGVWLLLVPGKVVIALAMPT
jgi:hypothetical protein